MHSLTTDYLEETHLKLVATLTKGTKTNYGIFSHWKGDCAIFENGWVGYQALHFIQIEQAPRPLVLKTPFVAKPLIGG